MGLSDGVRRAGKLGRVCRRSTGSVALRRAGTGTVAVQRAGARPVALRRAGTRPLALRGIGTAPVMHPTDAGVATVYACLGVVVLLVVTGLGVHLGAASLARQRAETGADLSALAGAAKVLQGPDVVCANVVRVAVANRVDVQSCVVTGTDVLVMVVARAGAGPFAGTAVGRARAGPVEVVGEGTN
jgi:secretion/DNA translocation related TadE-like protein